ncbi:MAG: 30S ribosomal protein S15, partial [Pseudomonadota bacterium]
IEDLAAHFQAHPKDHHSRLGLLKMINKRRSLLDYLRTASSNRYRALVERLGLRK